MSQWISVDDERKPTFSDDEESFSETILLFTPKLRRWSGYVFQTGIHMGHYLRHSKEFRQDGCLGLEKDVTHWQPLPDPPEAA